MKYALACIAAMAFTVPVSAEDRLTSGIASISIDPFTTLPPVSVRNLSETNTVQTRDLRVTSATTLPLAVGGQAFCKSLSGNNTLRSAQAFLGDAFVQQTPDGYNVDPLLSWAPTETVEYPPSQTGRDFDFTVEITFPDHASGQIALTLNPVWSVEEALEDHVANGGSAVDFLRTDQVFEVPLDVNVLVWCGWQRPGESEPFMFPGIAQRIATVRVFYQGDPDIVAGPAVDVAGDIQAQQPSRARPSVGSGRTGDSGPPARGTPPRRTQDEPRPPPRSPN